MDHENHKGFDKIEGMSHPKQPSALEKTRKMVRDKGVSPTQSQQQNLKAMDEAMNRALGKPKYPNTKN